MENNIPWSWVRNWDCRQCGYCCVNYRVPLTKSEAKLLSRFFGPDLVEWSKGKFRIKLKDGICPFLEKRGDAYFCKLQGSLKPYACKMWPFRIYREPKFGHPSDAGVNYGRRMYFVYLSSACRGIELGTPSPEFIAGPLVQALNLHMNPYSNLYPTGRVLERPLSQASSLSPWLGSSHHRFYSYL